MATFKILAIPQININKHKLDQHNNNNKLHLNLFHIHTRNVCSRVNHRVNIILTFHKVPIPTSTYNIQFNSSPHSITANFNIAYIALSKLQLHYYVHSDRLPFSLPHDHPQELYVSFDYFHSWDGWWPTKFNDYPKSCEMCQ